MLNEGALCLEREKWKVKTLLNNIGICEGFSAMSAFKHVKTVYFCHCFGLEKLVITNRFDTV